MQYASDELGNNKRVVSAALKQGVSALKFASSKQRGNIGVVPTALIKDRFAIFYISEEFIIAVVARYH